MSLTEPRFTVPQRDIMNHFDSIPASNQLRAEVLSLVQSSKPAVEVEPGFEGTLACSFVTKETQRPLSITIKVEAVSQQVGITCASYKNGRCKFTADGLCGQAKFSDTIVTSVFD